MGTSRHVSPDETGIINWVCWSIVKRFSYEEAEELFDLLEAEDKGVLWLKVGHDNVVSFHVDYTLVGELHVKGVLVAAIWGSSGPEEGFDAFQEHWDEYAEEQERAQDREAERLASIFLDGAPELVCPV